MFKIIPQDVAASRFHRKVGPLTVKSDKQGIRNLFADLTASACMEEGEGALETMLGELHEALEEPHRNIRRNLFPRL